MCSILPVVRAGRKGHPQAPAHQTLVRRRRRGESPGPDSATPRARAPPAGQGTRPRARAPPHAADRGGARGLIQDVGVGVAAAVAATASRAASYQLDSVHSPHRSGCALRSVAAKSSSSIAPTFTSASLRVHQCRKATRGDAAASHECRLCRRQRDLGGRPHVPDAPNVATVIDPFEVKTDGAERADGSDPPRRVGPAGEHRPVARDGDLRRSVVDATADGAGLRQPDRRNVHAKQLGHDLSGEEVCGDEVTTVVPASKPLCAFTFGSTEQLGRRCVVAHPLSAGENSHELGGDRCSHGVAH